MKGMPMAQQLYPKIHNIAMDVFELVFAIKMRKVVETVSLTHVIERVQYRLRFTDDMTTPILDMRQKTI